MKIINARLRRQEALFTLDLQDGMIHRITAQAAMQTADAGDIDARGRLAIPPFVEPHIHLDATLTAGEPEWNRSGTLFEGITRWSQRKASITPEDTRQRALKPSACCAISASSTSAPMWMSPTRRWRPCRRCWR